MHRRLNKYFLGKWIKNALGFYPEQQWRMVSFIQIGQLGKLGGGGGEAGEWTVNVLGVVVK